MDQKLFLGKLNSIEDILNELKSLVKNDQQQQDLYELIRPSAETFVDNVLYLVQDELKEQISVDSLNTLLLKIKNRASPQFLLESAFKLDPVGYELKKLIISGAKLEAVKLIKKQNPDFGLKEAKLLADKIEHELKNQNLYFS